MSDQGVNALAWLPLCPAYREGKDKIDKWLQMFENAVKVGSVPQDKVVAYLRLQMGEAGSPTLDDADETTPLDTLKTKLQEALGQHDPINTARRTLRTLKLEDEDFNKLARKVRELVKKANPDATDNCRARMEVTYFQEILSGEYGKQITMAEPKTLEEAKKIAIKTHMAHQHYGAANIMAVKPVHAESQDKTLLDAIQMVGNQMHTKMETMGNQMNTKMDTMKNDIQADISKMDNNIKGLQTDMVGVHSDMAGMQANISRIDREVINMRQQLYSGVQHGMYTPWAPHYQGNPPSHPPAPAYRAPAGHQNYNPRAQRPTNPVCYNCKQPGHIARNCPAKSSTQTYSLNW